MTESTQITGLFGSEAVPVPGLSGRITTSTTPAEPAKSVPFTDAALAGQPGIAEARAQREALALRPESGMLEAVGAAITQFDTYKLLTRAARPSFQGETLYNMTEFADHLDIVLDEDERKYLMEVGKGDKSAPYAVEQIKSKRAAYEVLGDHEVLAATVPLLDPVWAVIPPTIKIGKLAGRAGRVTSAVASGAVSASVTALGEGPKSDAEIATAFLLNAGVAATLYKPGKGLVKSDPDFPSAEMDAVLAETINPPTKPKMRMVSPAVFTETPVKPRAVMKPDGTWEMVEQPSIKTKVKDAVWEEVPKELQPHAVNTDAAAVVYAVDKELSRSASFGNKLMWNIHKTMSSYGPIGKMLADLMYDNNADLSMQSLESHRAIVRSELQAFQAKYEDGLRAAMAEDGHGMWEQMWSPRKSAQVQSKIESDVRNEMFRREQAERTGGLVIDPNVPERIRKMADNLQELHDHALEQLKKSGVEGAEAIEKRMGYFSRKWSSKHTEDVLDKLMGTGLSREQALKKVQGLVSASLRRGNNWEKRLSDQIGAAIVDRALRKGYFEDAVFNAPAGEGTMKQLRDIMKEAGMPHNDIERALDVMRVQSDDAGKASFMKHRVDLDYKVAMRVGNDTVRVTDLIDNRLTGIVDQYISGTATQVAFAKKGFGKLSAIEELRAELMHGTPHKDRDAAKQLFDDTINHWKGLPAGVRMNETMRNVQMFTRLVALPWSGLWQATEFATAAAEFGLLKTLKYAAKEFPGFSKVMSAASNQADARSLKNILTNHSTANLRLRPYLHRFEDGFEMDAMSGAQLSMQQAGMLVPYANGMKFIHSAQANLVSNLIIDRLEKAAAGDAKALAAMQKYGLDAQVMNKLKTAMSKHGYAVDSWDDALWESVRPAFGKMMDESVLHARLGDLPAFAVFDPTGKFIFSYRSFVLAAHNKILAGNMARSGAGAVGLTLLYQMPLTMLAVQAQSGIKGQGALDTKDMIAQSIGQMGGLGLLTEPVKWATGQSNAVGAPSFMALDRGIKTGQAALNGDAAKFGSSAMTLFPVAASAPWFRAISERLKD